MKKIYTLILLSFLTGCPMDRYEFGWNNINIVNTFNNKLYYTSNSKFTPNTLKSLNFNETKVVSMCIGNCSNNLDESLNFYQDIQKNCYLYSLNSSVFSGDYHGIIILQGNTYKKISRAEYEKLKPTFKPHPYDASLCKPAPKQ